MNTNSQNTELLMKMVFKSMKNEIGMIKGWLKEHWTVFEDDIQKDEEKREMVWNWQNTELMNMIFRRMKDEDKGVIWNSEQNTELLMKMIIRRDEE